MFVHKIPISSYKRLLLNDMSGSFKIIIKVRYLKKTIDNLEIQKQIIINTTVNKARLISRKINEEYINNPNINTYVIDLGSLSQNENHKIKIEAIISIFNALLTSNGENIVISENNINLFHQIIGILGNENEMNEQTKASNVVECIYLNNQKLNGIISYIQQITRDVVDGSNDHLRLSGSGTDYFHPLRNIIRYDKKNVDNYYINNGSATNPKHEDYIGFNFVNRKVNITGYTIRVPPTIGEYIMPKTWNILGSNDEQKWEVIDKKENNNEINKENICVYFECTNTGKFFKYIRFEQIGFYINIAAIEFFGYVTK